MTRAAGAPAVGRRWEIEQAKKDFRCEIVDGSFAAAQMRQDWGFPRSKTGTVVRWDGVKHFPHFGDVDAVERFLQAAFRSNRVHLGLIFHRLLERQDVRILLDVEDVTHGVLIRAEALALNPFGYPRSGAAGWPKKLRADKAKKKLSLVCHIWPGRSSLDEFKLDGNLIERQGLYVYFNDRLVQRGGWNGLVHADKQLNLARVEVSVGGDIDRVLAINPEKQGIEVGPEFASILRAARAKDRTTFDDYIEQARGAFKDANRRKRVRGPMLPAGAGFAPKVRRAFRAEFPERDDESVDVRWTRLPDDEFFALDRDECTLWLNRGTIYLTHLD